MKSAVFFTALATGFFINEVASVQLFDLKTFLKTLQQQLKQEQDVLSNNGQNSDEEEDSYGSLKKSDLENLLSYSSKKSRSSRPNKNSKNQDFNELRRPVQHNEALNSIDLSSLLNNIKQQSSAVNYISSSDSNQRDDEENESPNEYSKVYVVLNSEAVKRSKNKEKLNALLSSLLAAPPAPVRNAPRRPRKRNERKQPLQLMHYNQRGYKNYDTKNSVRLPYRYDGDDHQQNEARYKGFIIDARRSRDSKEKLKARDTIHKLQSSELWKDSPQKTLYTNTDGDLDLITTINFDKLQPSYVSKRFFRVDLPTVEGLQRSRFDEPMERPRGRSRDRGMRGGRSGGSSRTAIPYIRHHGDIYEKDN